VVMIFAGQVPLLPVLAHVVSLCRESRDGQHRAPGMGQAIAAHPAVNGPGQGPAVASSDDQQVSAAGRDGGQHRAGLATLYARPDGHVVRDVPPGGREGVAEPLPSVLSPDAAQVAARAAPVGELPPGGVQARTGMRVASLARTRCSA
jgi:hypothetical protein